MKKNNNQKSIIFLIILSLVGVIGGTIAFFTNSEKFTNLFKTQEFSTITKENFVSPDNWTPGTRTPKLVKVTNSGKVPVVVRALVEDKGWHKEGKILNNDTALVTIEYDEKEYSDWISVEEDGKKYFYYKYILGISEDDKTTKSSFIQAVIFNNEAKNDELCTYKYIYSDGTEGISEIPPNGEKVISKSKTCTPSENSYSDATYELDITIEIMQAEHYKEAWGTNVEITSLYTPNYLIDEMKKSNLWVIDENLNFSDTNTAVKAGYYIRSETNEKTENYQGEPIYYYRGTVKNNNVILGNICWLIVRTTETGGIKLIYNGLAKDGKCLSVGKEKTIGKAAYYNTSKSSIAFAGYMRGIKQYNENDESTYENDYYNKSFGTVKAQNYIFGNDIEYINNHYYLKDKQTNFDSTHHYTCLSETEDSCEKVSLIVGRYGGTVYYINLSNGDDIDDAKNLLFSNKYDSDLKIKVDKWYEKNMISYTDFLEDAVWCNDRELSFSALISKDSDLYESYFMSYGRNLSIASKTISPYPALKEEEACALKNDRFTVSEENGNGALTYPVGLITADELTAAGFVYGDIIPLDELYLSLGGSSWWSMTPFRALAGGVYPFSAGIYSDNDSIWQIWGINEDYLRPMISLKGNIEIHKTGDGTKENPYIIKL